MRADPPLYLFAKEPVPGRVKTRLQDRLSAEQCADLAQQMLLQSVQTATRFWPGERILCVLPRRNAAIFQSLAARYRLAVVEQCGADLGARLLTALQAGVDAAGAAAVMGCDVPHIDGAILQAGYRRLSDGEDVIGPSIDGGFYLLGLHRLPPTLFDRIEWGGNTVRTRLVRRAQQLGIRLHQLERLRDIDRWEDVLWLAGRDRRYARFVAQSTAPTATPNP